MIRDNYPGATVSSDHQSGDSFELGSTKVTYTALDAAGNATTDSFNIVVSDKEPPVFTSYPEHIVDSLASNEILMDISWDLPEVFDPCSEVNLSSTHESGSFFGPGITEVFYTAEDEFGNSSSISFLVQIERPLHLGDHSISSKITVYPVPADNKLKVSLPKADGVHIRLFSITGTELKQMKCSSREEEIDVSGLPAGIYILHIELNDRTYLEKAIIR